MITTVADHKGGKRDIQPPPPHPHPACKNLSWKRWPPNAMAYGSFTSNNLLPTVWSDCKKLGAAPIAFQWSEVSPIGQSGANLLKIYLVWMKHYTPCFLPHPLPLSRPEVSGSRHWQLFCPANHNCHLWQAPFLVYNCKLRSFTKLWLFLAKKWINGEKWLQPGLLI